ncbi:MAG: c-type cytochrome [Nitrospira sp.]|nr:c-type cytochrome [Nitrospira sp.]
MRGYTVAGIVMLSLCILTTGCVPPPRVSGTLESADVGEQTSRIDPVFVPPSPDTIPGDQRGDAIRMGYLMVVDTQQYGKRYVGNALNCTNCHLDAGLNPNAASFVGISTLYPQHDSRTNRVMSLKDRINDCVERNLNGTPIPQESTRLSGIVAYIEWLSQNVPRGSAVPWRGISRLTSTHPPDSVNGKNVFEKKCGFCHGTDGQGSMAAPPVWGPRSYTIGADMARVGVAASFIKANMPRGWGWTVTDDEAFDVAVYINSQPRPDFPGKANDWLKGGKPEDVPY